MGVALPSADLFGYTPPQRPRWDENAGFVDVDPPNRRPDAQRERAQGGDCGGAGLSKAHTSTASGIVGYLGAGLIEVTSPQADPRPTDDEKLGGGIRGRVYEFSKGSARRFRRELATVERQAFSEASLVTLTYPDAFPAPESHIIYKYHLDRFKTELRRYFERRGATASGHWRLEFQKRGAAHYHLLVYGVGAFRDLDQLLNIRKGETRRERRRRLRCFGRIEDDLCAIWFGIVGSGDPKHRRAGVTMEALETVGGGSSYMAKYAGKTDQTRPGDFTGRYWGTMNRPQIPRGRKCEVNLPPDVALCIRRVARKYMKSGCEKGAWERTLREARERLMETKLTRGGLEKLFAIKVKGDQAAVEWVFGSGDRPSCVQRSVRREDVLRLWNLQGMFDRDRPPIRPPGRYRLRNNQRVSLICDATRFWSDILRLIPDPDFEPF